MERAAQMNITEVKMKAMPERVVKGNTEENVEDDMRSNMPTEVEGR